MNVYNEQFVARASFDVIRILIESTPEDQRELEILNLLRTRNISLMYWAVDSRIMRLVPVSITSFSKDNLLNELWRLYNFFKKREQSNSEDSPPLIKFLFDFVVQTVPGFEFLKSQKEIFLKKLIDDEASKIKVEEFDSSILSNISSDFFYPYKIVRWLKVRENLRSLLGNLCFSLFDENKLTHLVRNEEFDLQESFSTEGYESKFFQVFTKYFSFYKNIEKFTYLNLIFSDRLLDPQKDIPSTTNIFSPRIFPKLEYLEIESLGISSEALSFPTLKTLVIKEMKFRDGSVIMIPSLRKLVLIKCSFLDNFIINEKTVQTPNLKSLILKDNLNVRLNFGAFPLLEEFQSLHPIERSNGGINGKDIPIFFGNVSTLIHLRSVSLSFYDSVQSKILIFDLPNLEYFEMSNITDDVFQYVIIDKELPSRVKYFYIIWNDGRKERIW
jgi:hypothetical protein